jgi:hypothetical protein
VLKHNGKSGTVRICITIKIIVFEYLKYCDQAYFIPFLPMCCLEDGCSVNIRFCFNLYSGFDVDKRHCTSMYLFYSVSISYFVNKRVQGYFNRL